MRPQIVAIAAGLGLVLAGSVAITAEAGATAATSKPKCVVVALAAKTGTVLQLSVSAVTATKGECVRFRNETDSPATVVVQGTTYREVIRAGGITTGTANYTASKSSTVDAVSGLRSGNGTLTVTAASPSPSPTATATPTSSRTTSPRATSKSTASASASASATPHKHAGKIVLPPLPPLPSGGVSGLPQPSNPLVAPGATTPAAIAPVSGTQSVATAATVLEPTSGSSRGLPVLVALVVLVGLICGYGRVLLAVPNRPESADRRRHRA